MLLDILCCATFYEHQDYMQLKYRIDKATASNFYTKNSHFIITWPTNRTKSSCYLRPAARDVGSMF